MKLWHYAALIGAATLLSIFAWSALAAIVMVIYKLVLGA